MTTRRYKIITMNGETYQLEIRDGQPSREPTDDLGRAVLRNHQRISRAMKRLGVDEESSTTTVETW